MRTAYAVLGGRRLLVLEGPADHDLRDLRAAYFKSVARPLVICAGDSRLAVTLHDDSDALSQAQVNRFARWLVDTHAFSRVDVRSADEFKADEKKHEEDAVAAMNDPNLDLPAECNQPGVWE